MHPQNPSYNIRFSFSLFPHDSIEVIIYKLCIQFIIFTAIY